jgi:putative transposase
MDDYLGRTSQGPLLLRQEAIASLVVEALFRGVELGHYEMRSFVLMPNHVHALLLPRISPSAFLKSLKGTTAHHANRLLGRTGQPFWQHESYDHWVRDEREWRDITNYIENNPVAAGLVSSPEQFRWSSANERYRPL